MALDPHRAKAVTVVDAATGLDLDWDTVGGGASDGLVVSGSVTSATNVIAATDTAGYGSVAVQVTSAGSTCTIAYEASNDGVTYYSVAGYTPLNTGSGIPVTTSTTAILLVFPVVARYFQARVSTYGSGTVAATAFFRKETLPSRGVFVGANQGSSSALFVQGSTAHDAGIAGAPVRLAGRALTADYTAVSNGDVADLKTTLVGSLVTRPHALPEVEWSYAAATSGIVNTTTAVTIKAADATHRNYVTSIQVMAEALGTATELAIRDGAGGTVLWRTKIGTGGLTTGFSAVFANPLRGSAATLLEVVTLTASTTGAVYFSAQGYVAP